MPFAICPISVAPVRSGTSHKSEQVSQLLFGEVVEVFDRVGRQWTKVRCVWDNQIGWVDAKQLKPITASEFESFQSHFAFNLDLIQPLQAKDHYLPITIGAHLPHFDGMRFQLDQTTYTFSGQAVFPENIHPTTEMILKIARRYLYAPVQWGGRSPFGVDASGLTQVVYGMIGISLPREPKQQVFHGEIIDFVEQTQVGDLAFFENRKGVITHVGILLNDAQILHASGQVRIDKLDHYGIYNEDLRRYSHRLRVIKRHINTEAKKIETEAEKVSIGLGQVELF